MWDLNEELALDEQIRKEAEENYLTGVRIPPDIQIRLTCISCPEQYDVLRNDRQIGYIRFRGGRLRVEYPDVHGELLFFEHWPDDPYRSEWDTQDQRAHDLTRFIEMLVRHDGPQTA